MDSRCEPMAYITDGSRLCEVVRVESRKNYGLGASPLGDVIVEDCRTGVLFAITRATVVTCWRLVQPAPEFDLPVQDAA